MLQRALGALVSVILVAGLVPSQADIVRYDLVWEFSGGWVPSGPAPWARATFEDIGLNQVSLTMESRFIVQPDEYIKGWYFNFEPPGEGFDLDHLSILYDSGVEPEGVFKSWDTYAADGDGSFDILFDFWNDNSDANRFAGEDSAVFTITGTGITAWSFFGLSFPGGNSPDGLYTAAHVGSIGPDGEESGWITIPAPGAALLGMMGLAVVGLVKRRIG